MADTVEALQKRVKELRDDLAKAHERRREENEDLRTALHVALVTRWDVERKRRVRG